MLTLSIDTAADRLAVALWRGGADGTSAGERDLTLARAQGDALFELVGILLEEAGAKPADITRVATISGPGNFTGIRIGLAAARGLALALEIPALAIDAFALIVADDAERHPAPLARLVAIDARRGEIYCRLFQPDLSPAGPPQVLAPEAALGLAASASIVIGSGAPALAAAARAAGNPISCRHDARPPARHLARLAASAPPADWPPIPLYVRPPDAKLPPASPVLAGTA